MLVIDVRARRKRIKREKSEETAPAYIEDELLSESKIREEEPVY
jgi:hypothetical protein